MERENAHRFFPILRLLQCPWFGRLV